MLSILLMLTQIAAAPQGAPDLGGGSDKPIVVYGFDLEASGRDLTNCIARTCAPIDDVNATLAHAENQFMSGDYAAARATVRASRKRNGEFARSSPVAVAELARVDARLSALVGLSNRARITNLDALDILNSGLTRDHPRALRQRLQVADIFARQGRMTAAAQIYDKVAKRARAAKLGAVEGEALFRSVALYAAAASVAPAYQPAAKAAIKRIEDTRDPALMPYRRGVALLKARLALLSGKHKQADAVIARLTPAAGTPVLLYAPRIELATVSSAWRVATDAGDKSPQWVDLQFTIAADGKVRAIELLRQSPTPITGWLDAARKSLAARRYAPLLFDTADGEEMRIERFTLVEDRISSSRSRIRGRGDARIDITDLTFVRPKTLSMK